MSNAVLYLLDSERLVELLEVIFLFVTRLYFLFIYYVWTSICLVNMTAHVFLVSFLNLEIGTDVFTLGHKLFPVLG